ncbi:GNAT family N-acetyltransferase [Desulfopila aestuarii]|uniref:Ribosomal-protein-serine acetyltransferase n=1 Tax=Desulfopila aestuarii DSM 18488 TaxID=1121416 RepID=A0A1M7YMR0_9BACT|nr:GNAT family protein [Desulfopila aestuarii]SHO53924.1 ribosomal-protein-serine acetyltransferase [Desulfopila aestuarii DSM 18488]
MFYHKIDKDLQLALSIPQFAEEMFALTDKNREHLKQWLPWPDQIVKVSDTTAFISLQLKRFSEGEAIHLSIFYKNMIAGVIAYNIIDQANGTAKVGYWLGKEYTGKGIMLKAVRELLFLGFEYWPIQKIEIHCAETNTKSTAIPEKLGFKNEGLIRRTAKVDDTYQNHIIFGILREEFHSDYHSHGFHRQQLSDE